MSSSKRKRERTPSLSLENMLHSMTNDGVNLRMLLELQTTLANTDLKDVVKREVIPEDLVLLWTVSKIGFLNTMLLRNCIMQVPKAYDHPQEKVYPTRIQQANK